MLEATWEVYATALANAETDEAMASEYDSLASKLNISDSPARIVLARDTRESGPALVTALLDALASVGAEVDDRGLLTTPQLHYLVRCLNTQNTADAYGDPTENGYYIKLGRAYEKLLQGRAAPGPVTVDCANGVGAPKLHALAKHISKELFDVKVVNDLIDEPSKLNSQVPSIISN